MNLMQKKRYEELKKKYAYELAVERKHSLSGESVPESELFSALMLFDLQNAIADNINDFIRLTGGTTEDIGMVAMLLSESAGQVMEKISKMDVEYANAARDLCLALFNEKLGGTNDSGTET